MSSFDQDLVCAAGLMSSRVRLYYCSWLDNRRMDLNMTRAVRVCWSFYRIKWIQTARRAIRQQVTVCLSTPSQIIPHLPAGQTVWDRADSIREGLTDPDNGCAFPTQVLKRPQKWVKRLREQEAADASIRSSSISCKVNAVPQIGYSFFVEACAEQQHAMPNLLQNAKDVNV